MAPFTSFRWLSPSVSLVLAGWLLVGCDDGASACEGEACVPDAAPDAPVDAPLEPSPVSALLPAYLSETGLYADVAGDIIADGVMTYTPRWQLYSDGAAKRRWLKLPSDGDAILPFDTTDMDHWVAPVGTKAWKEFSSGNTRVETRYFVKGELGWEGVSYIWLADGSDAVVAPDGKVNAAGTELNVPDMASCRQCHDRAGDSLLGLDALQLDTEALSGDETLATLAAAGALSAPPVGTTPFFPVGGTTQEVAALGYLHVNCGTCHNATSDLNYLPVEFRMLSAAAATPAQSPTYQTAIGTMASMQICDGSPVTCAELVIAPGDPAASVLYRRFVTNNPARHMPPLGTEILDESGRALLFAWITALQAP